MLLRLSKKALTAEKYVKPKVCANINDCKEKETPTLSPCSFYKEKIRMVMRILIGIFLLSAEMTAQRITYAIGIISTNSALFFDQSPSVSK